MFLDMYDGNTYKKHTMVLSWLFRHSSTTVLPQYFRHVPLQYYGISLPCSTSTTVLQSDITIILWYRMVGMVLFQLA